MRHRISGRRRAAAAAPARPLSTRATRTTSLTAPVVLAALAVGAMTLAAPAVLAAADLRIPLVELRLAGERAAALEATERALAERPEEATAAGLDYLRGRLLEELGRGAEARAAYARAMAGPQALRPYVRYHLALAEMADNHPEVAAGLVAAVFAQNPPTELRRRASELLFDAVAAGGDCRVLDGVLARDLPKPERRLLDVAAADCSLRRGQRGEATARLRRLLAEDLADDPARRAAERVARLLERRPATASRASTLELERLAGLAFHQHRQYERSIPLLEPVAEGITRGGMVASDEEFEVRYAIARGYFWRELFDQAADRYADLALRARDLEERSQVLYQQARSHELAGDWGTAAAVFRRAYLTAPRARYGGPALLSTFRITWRTGDEGAALELYRMLERAPNADEHIAYAALFMASSDLVRGVSDRPGAAGAGAWLDTAERLDRNVAVEVAYWRGRLAELEGAPERAIGHYLDLALDHPYHPLTRDGLERLARPPLAGPAARTARRLAGSGENADLAKAARLAAVEPAAARAAGERLVARYRADARLAPYFRLRRVPVADWPLWRGQLDDRQEMLVALGQLDEGAAAVGKLFPVDRPDLGYTGGQLLADTDEVRRAITIGDLLGRRIARVPDPLLPDEIRRLLHPLPWRATMEREGRRFGVDPHLLAAIAREESRFDPRALSGASARGLTQFVWLTARRLAAETGMGAIDPEDLYRPEVALALGAAYLAELRDRSRGSLHQTIASYNAGPSQAQLWSAYSYTGELAEYYTKTGFDETRAYLRRVLGSYARYGELY